MSEYSEFALLECFLMLPLLEDNQCSVQLLSIFMYLMLTSAVFVMEYSKLITSKSSRLFLVTRKWSAENCKSLFHSVVWWLLLPQHCWKFQGKALWLEWKWRVNFLHLDTDSDQEQSDPGRILWQNICFWGRQMQGFTTARFIQKRKKEKISWWSCRKGGETGGMCLML